MAVGAGKYIVAANGPIVFVSNYVKDRTKFTELFEVKGVVQHMEFCGGYLIVQSTHGLYLGSLIEGYKILGHAELLMLGIKEFYVAGEYVVSTDCQSDILISKITDYSHINPEQRKTTEVKDFTNPLDNAGHYCAGGFGNMKGC